MYVWQFSLDNQFPSPLGDKFQPEKLKECMHKASFRPLAGINFNFQVFLIQPIIKSFHPLTGINFNERRP